MDIWKFFDIGHADHTICNPTNSAKLDEMISMLDLPEGGRILDIGCGKGEFLLRACRKWGCSGVGVDLSPPFVRAARKRVAEAGSGDEIDIEIIEGEGATFDANAGSFDLTVCLGASWIFAGHSGTLDALSYWTRPGGRVLVGEPHWLMEPSKAYLEATHTEPDAFATHSENLQEGVRRGLVPLYSIASTADDWDRYEGLQWRAAERWARAESDDPDVEGVLDLMHRNRDTYLSWGRDTLGWAMYLFLDE